MHPFAWTCLLCAYPRVVGTHVSVVVSHARQRCLPRQPWLITCLLDGTWSVDLFSCLKYSICLNWAFVRYSYMRFLHANAVTSSLMTHDLSSVNLRLACHSRQLWIFMEESADLLCCQSTCQRIMPPPSLFFFLNLQENVWVGHILQHTFTHTHRVLGFAKVRGRLSKSCIGARPRVTAWWRQRSPQCWYRDIIGVLSLPRDPKHTTPAIEF